MEELIIKEAHNLVSTYTKDEGKEQVTSKGKCPLCNNEIVFIQSIVRKDWSEALASKLYECFLMNNELCFKCRHLCEAWIKEHKELCIKHDLKYRDIGNKLLEKQGKEPIIGISKEEIDDDDDNSSEHSAILEETAQETEQVPAILSKIEVAKV